ncbi:Os07g0503400 [Oryza sativa Japonica Group]|uniref:Os07g0503400 protein n=2 Tax=Oryza sativa subsp. japonica TaxID=39947 RepID=A0A0P0X6S1_ORYSJ|nr:Os07g0503400 [Oryza sativa Japonica Group]
MLLLHDCHTCPPLPPSRSSLSPPPSRPRRPSFTLNTHQASFAAPSAQARPTVGAEVPTFAEFSQAELRAAMGGFAASNIVSESGEKASNLVYRGRLQGAGRAVGMLLPQQDAQLYLVGIT